MFSNFFKKSQPQQSEDPFTSWIRIEFGYGKPNLEDMYSFEDRLRSIVDPTELGEVDGNEIATDLSDGSYFIVCKNVSDILPLIKDELKTTSLVSVRRVTKRSEAEEEYLEVSLD